ncbi:hypothetical protein HPB47_006443 [Ixodes persulcatus]|uniref:Uncharacterized protein n=1 Tax=Ixodes persulcatus TaxID=34615 RepID=A0AC60PAV7_IXOPE|nr:hypothetical protein HPB47_006443 [Ixodes persulcatus]
MSQMNFLLAFTLFRTVGSSKVRHKSSARSLTFGEGGNHNAPLALYNARTRQAIDRNFMLVNPCALTKDASLKSPSQRAIPRRLTGRARPRGGWTPLVRST